MTAFARARASWPLIGLGLERFASAARGRGVPEEALTARPADLLLAFACADGDPSALEYFEAEFLSQVPLYVARFSLNEPTLDEVRQRLRIKLLVGSPPGIGGYRGTGPLGAWVRVTAVRTALDLLGDGAAASRAEISLLDLGIRSEDDPELATVKHLYRDRFKQALEEAIDALEPRDKTILRLSVVDALNIDAIAAIYRVHRATVARWLVSIRARVLATFRQRLDLPVLASPSEVRSLIGVLYEDIHISTARILANPR